ncbi:uncharacterized protein PHALS_02052 [Plasmopara halstedii]|uniref:Uncharacterized protein n=1 Tax=Plasmopara halstedii TaxID=4781 RepID=A0A0N7L711_PLAHL|nr:uncharacterized protein PHALS_02052 [Plasmopara halstedii]CEG45779.1 hypothetical protein PHALS_02052 [Plasmopara halstedii]|eukprot:XP_024582148.1 hypothetical protein PHALS_02052 [Plasmopara halstedii]
MQESKWACNIVFGLSIALYILKTFNIETLLPYAPSVFTVALDLKFPTVDFSLDVVVKEDRRRDKLAHRPDSILLALQLRPASPTSQQYNSMSGIG